MSSRPGVTFRPRVEALEAREVPATCLWLGSNDPETGTDATVAENWWNYGISDYGVPGEDDTIEFAMPLGGGMPRNCTNLSGEFAGFVVWPIYSATITLSGPVTTEGMIVGGGTIDQPYGADITVTSSFYWYDGIINSTANLANLTFDNATATIEPYEGGTVYLGSNLNLTNGAFATMKEGTIEILNDGVAFNIYENCVFQVNPGQGKVAKTKVSGGAGIFGNDHFIASGGVLEVYDGGTYIAEHGWVENHGAFIIEPGTKAEFGSSVPFVSPAVSFLTTGSEFIAADATLKLTFGMKKTAGLISIKTGAKPAEFVANIIGEVRIVKGDVVFDTAYGLPWDFGEFWIKGNVFWQEGVFFQRVSAEESYVGDFWKVFGGTFSIGGVNTSPTIHVTAIDADASPVTPAANTEWYLFEVYGPGGSGIVVVNDNHPSLVTDWVAGAVFVIDQQLPNRWRHVKSN